MIRWPVVLFLALSVPLGLAQSDAFAVERVEARAGNQRVDLTWPPVQDPDPAAPSVTGYAAYVFEGGQQVQRQTVNGTQTTFFLTNGRTYTFQVAALLSDGSEAPRSAPVAATPAFDNDLEYLAAGLIVTWIGLFGYAAFLSRREARLDRKLEQLLAHRGGRNP